MSAETGEEVPDEHIVKGYEVSKGRYVVVDPDELEPFIPSATKSDRPRGVRRPRRDRPGVLRPPYFVAPDKTPKPYVLLAQAMEEAGKVAIGRFVMRNKQYVAAIRAVDGTLLMMSTMVFADEVGRPATIDELERARRHRRQRQGGEDGRGARRVAVGRLRPAKYHDAYREQVLDLIERKAAGEEFEAPERRGRGAEGRRPDGRARGQRRRRPRTPRRPPSRQAGRDRKPVGKRRAGQARGACASRP